VTWSEFFSMGGYAFFVWGSYLVAFIAIAGEVMLLWRRKQTLKQAGLALKDIGKHEETT